MIINFNSNMVRLRSLWLFIVSNSIFTFQFQYGTIEVCARLVCCIPMLEISIPIWYDWGESPLAVPIVTAAISIPIWYDWGGLFTFGFFGLFHISIPIWYDWGTKILGLRLYYAQISIPIWYDWGLLGNWIDKFFINFNSNMVRLRL